MHTKMTHTYSKHAKRHTNRHRVVRTTRTRTPYRVGAMATPHPHPRSPSTTQQPPSPLPGAPRPPPQRRSRHALAQRGAAADNTAHAPAPPRTRGQGRTHLVRNRRRDSHAAASATPSVFRRTMAATRSLCTPRRRRVSARLAAWSLLEDVSRTLDRSSCATMATPPQGHRRNTARGQGIAAQQGAD